MTGSGRQLPPLPAPLRRLGRERVRDLLRYAAERIMEHEVESLCGGLAGSRRGRRTPVRAGRREAVWRSSVGDIDVLVPGVRRANYIPFWRSLGSAGEEGLLNVIGAACTGGAGDGAETALARQLESCGLYRHEVDGLCRELRRQVRLQLRADAGSRPDAIVLLERRIAVLETEGAALRQAVNALCRECGLPPRYRLAGSPGGGGRGAPNASR